MKKFMSLCLMLLISMHFLFSTFSSVKNFAEDEPRSETDDFDYEEYTEFA